jgi:hypothetical protein
MSIVSKTISATRVQQSMKKVITYQILIPTDCFVVMVELSVQGSVPSKQRTFPLSSEAR